MSWAGRKVSASLHGLCEVTKQVPGAHSFLDLTFCLEITIDPYNLQKITGVNEPFPSAANGMSGFLCSFRINILAKLRVAVSGSSSPRCGLDSQRL